MTVGGNDRSIMQWRYDAAKDEDETKGGEGKDGGGGGAGGAAKASEGKEAEWVHVFPYMPETKDEEEGDGTGYGNELDVEMPWRATAMEPYQVPDFGVDKPAVKLELEFVHGYVCRERGVVRDEPHV